MNLIRSCPDCSCTLQYSTKYTFKQANDNNSRCKRCVASLTFKEMHIRMRNGELKYGFKGKTHNTQTKEKISKSITIAYNEGRLNVSGEKNGMTGKHIPNKNKGRNFDQIYGIKKSNEIRKKLSKASSGSNNPMFGKPSPKGSGNGISGWYNGWYFRSLHELSFMINVIECFEFNWINGESIPIKYIDFLGKERTYFPDFIINERYMIEIKPKKLHKSDEVIRKSEAASQFCKLNGLIYKLVDPSKKLSNEEIKELISTNQVKLSKQKDYDRINRGSKERR